jgi:hypothetical protein
MTSAIRHRGGEGKKLRHGYLRDTSGEISGDTLCISVETGAILYLYPVYSVLSDGYAY